MNRIVVFVLVITVTLVSCSRKKSTFTRRAYHNTTSHYNYYFNARELIRAHLRTIEEGYTDDYNYQLPIFVYGTDEQSSAAYSEMDEVIKKCSRLIDRHSIYLKQEEHNRWVDESYLLVGQARFHKQEYYGAIEIFEYMEIVYKGKPSYYEAMLWMAKCYIQMEDYRESFNILDDIKESDVPQEIKGEYYAVWADYFVKSGGEKAEASYNLKQSIENTKKLKIKRRYTYILAQMYHEQKDFANATDYYGKVLKMRPDYRMSFNARLNQARSYDVSANNSKSIKKRLFRMLRDKKNIEFKDQIYFALAELAFREEDEDLGMEYLRKSAQSSVNNNKVKAEAYMLLGDIYYDKPKYIKAHAYYDSCITILPETHEKFEKVEERKESLDDLVLNLNIISKEDSLQVIAAMDEKDRNKLIDDIIREVELKEELERQRLESGFATSYAQANKSSLTTGSWYFYNVSVKSFGVSEFRTRWGQRAYEDNWRRSIKAKEVEFSEGEEELAVADTAASGLDNKDPEYYLLEVPLSDSSMQASHGKIATALYAAGNIYREQFVDYNNAIYSFERLVEDYDTSRYVESSYYQLYRIYLLLDDQTMANRYRDIILNDYPFSEYARIIKNPSYMANKRDKREQVEAYYKATYQLYQYRIYSDVIDACDKSDTLFGAHHLRSNFAFLRALAIGKQKKMDEFKDALEELIAEFPSSDQAVAAQKIIDRMNSNVEAKESREALYKKNFRDEHIFVVMTPNLSTSVESVKLTLSDYNVAKHGVGELNVTSVLFDKDHQMVSVKSFKNRDEGMLYIQNVGEYPEYENNVAKKGYESFLISMENYAYFYQKKGLKDYLSFYNDHYLNK